MTSGSNYFMHPLQSNIQCRLKWSHSTVFLTTNTTASCHRVNQDVIPENFDFHNTKAKVVAREQMLKDEWPGKGCEHCSVIEDAGGTSDRMLHSKWPHGPESAKELRDNPAQTSNLTPTELEIFFSSNCQMSCTYCGQYFSTTWEAENKKFGHIDEYLYGFATDNDPRNFKTDYTGNVKKLKEKLFVWLDENIQHLRELYILGGEPFTQPETFELFDFLSTKKCPELTLSINSNLSLDPKRIERIIDKLQTLRDNGNLGQYKLIASLDCWGKEAEYVRSGLNLEWFENNLNYFINNTDMNPSINMCWMPLTTFTMGDLIDKMNAWNEQLFEKNRTMRDSSFRMLNVSMMQAAGRPCIHPSIFGPQILDWGYTDAINNLETFGEQTLISTKEYWEGIAKSISASTPNKELQKQLHNFLSELDRRRGTNYPALFPVVYDAIHSDS